MVYYFMFKFLVLFSSISFNEQDELEEINVLMKIGFRMKMPDFISINIDLVTLPC